MPTHPALLQLPHLWVAAYGRVAIILALALCIGYPAVRRAVRGPAAPVVAILTGLAGLSFGVSILSWARIFNGWTVAALAAVALSVTARLLRQDLPRWRTRLRRPPRPRLGVVAVFGILALLLAAGSFLPLYPSTAFDVTSYHLPLARDLVDQHGLVYDPFTRYSFFPQANESVFAVMLLLSRDPVVPAALEYCVLALSVLLVPLWFAGAGRRPAAGFVGALVVMASPVVVFAGTAALVDCWALAFLAAALLVGLEAAEGRAPPGPALLVAGALLGEAAATKYTGAAFGVAVAGGILIAGTHRVWSRAPLMALCAVAVALPWYAWTYHVTGDPLYPFATGLFGNRGGLWTPAEIAYQDTVARAFVDPGLLPILHRDLDYMRGLVPHEVGAGTAPLSWVLAIGLLRLAFPSAWRDRTYLGAALASVLCVGLWIAATADQRYVVPAAGLLGICAALAADWAMGAVGPPLARAHLPSVLASARLAPLWAAATAVAVLWPSLGYAHRVLQAGGNPAKDAAGTSSYLAVRIPCYAAIEYLNGLAGDGYRAYAIGCEQARYYADGRTIGDVFSTGSYPRVYDDGGLTLPADTTLLERLRPLDVQWFVATADHLPDPAALQVHGLFRLRGHVGGAYVFQITA